MGRKHWEKEKLLVTSNFSFSHSFQKASFRGASKGVVVWEWVKLHVVCKCFELGSLKICPLQQDSFLSHGYPLFRQCEKAARGLERILGPVPVKKNSRKAQIGALAAAIQLKYC